MGFSFIESSLIRGAPSTNSWRSTCTSPRVEIFFNFMMVTWSHSMPFSFPTNILYNYTHTHQSVRIRGRLGKPRDPFHEVALQTLWIVWGFTANFIKPLLPGERTEQPWYMRNARLKNLAPMRAMRGGQCLTIKHSASLCAIFLPRSWLSTQALQAH